MCSHHLGDMVVGAAGTEVDKLVKGIKDIVGVVLKGKGSANAGDANNAKKQQPMRLKQLEQ
ncbi:hypothetical protein BHO_0013600 (plasmid) [Borrelia hermsii YBT]|uniref:Variable large protein n=1 Tax=Borrelia hermsii YBT TaxID=1313295 RepID=W5T2H2_BORHE|nr:hypothetical protein BHO_0013600 [Borrelia hermsii YBT]